MTSAKATMIQSTQVTRPRNLAVHPGYPEGPSARP